MIQEENLSRLWSSIIIDELVRNGVTEYYCAPGMRNAPILSAIHTNTTAKPYSFIDERALSYRALGNAKNSEEIPALTCTSGTAIANFLPAVIEAYKSGIPMLILTADRPIELVKIDANQTIDQTSVIREYTSFQINLEAPSESISAKRLRSLISQAVGKAIITSRPVHINIPLREPLDSTKTIIDSHYLQEARNSFNKALPKTNTRKFYDFSYQEDIALKISQAKRPLIVIGKNERLKNRSEYIRILKEIDIPKYVDITSGIKYAFTLKDKLNPSFDHPEVFNAWNENKPDLIIHIGGRLVSKHYYRFQEENPEIEVIHITDTDTNHDPGFSNNTKLVCTPLSFMKFLSGLNLSADSPIDWQEFTQKKIDIIENQELSFPYISKKIIENIDSKSNLVIANSMSIRSFDNYISSQNDYDIPTF